MVECSCGERRMLDQNRITLTDIHEILREHHNRLNRP